MNSERTRVSLASTLHQAGSRDLECSLQVPPTWSLTRASAERVILMADELDSFASDRFAPNIVITAEEASDKDGAYSGPPTILGAASGSHVFGSVRRSVTIDSSEDRLLFQLVGKLETELGEVTAVCTALDTQWQSVSEAFDMVIDTLVISEAEEVGNNGN